MVNWQQFKGDTAELYKVNYTRTAALPLVFITII